MFKRIEENKFQVVKFNTKAEKALALMSISILFQANIYQNKLKSMIILQKIKMTNLSKVECNVGAPTGKILLSFLSKNDFFINNCYSYINILTIK